MKEKIKLCGISNNIKGELEKAKLFVLSSNYEGMPNVLIEAMAMGLPVISTDCPCGGPREIIENGKNGILVPTGDEKELEKEIIKILKDNEYANFLGKNAQKIGKKLSEKEIITQWEEYIKKVYQENIKK